MGYKFLVILFSAFLIASSRDASALPFNDDMVSSKNSEGRHMYYSTGQIMRAKPEGSVSVGMLDYYVATPEEAQSLVNPVTKDEKSWKLGKRLFQVNCSPCHGNIEATNYIVGPVGTKLLKAPPNITEGIYLDKSKLADGYFYRVIHFGLGLMPALGWKLSPEEHWNIVNYVRHVQDTKK